MPPRKRKRRRVPRKGFQFRKRRSIETIPPIKPKVVKDNEGLTGFVRGFRASDIEERFARALDKLGIYFWFQYKVETQLSLPDQDKRVDFVVFHTPGQPQPIEIYGVRWHSSSGDRNRDRARQREINEAGDDFNWLDLIVIWEYDLANQQMADAMARSIFL